MAWLSPNILAKMGFAAIGQNVLVSNKASFYNCANITLGNNVRIDDFCVFSAGGGGIYIGNYVHIAIGCSLIGEGKITISDFSTLSSRVAIYSSNDDYSGATMTNPTVPNQYTGVIHADVFLDKHVIVGSGSVIMPSVKIEHGVAVGALSLIKKDCKAFGVYCGIPAKRIGDRKKGLLKIEQSLLCDSDKLK